MSTINVNLARMVNFLLGIGVDILDYSAKKFLQVDMCALLLRSIPV